eukprot:TRINITY_DN2081_c0_g1_i4.p1 TRINITY_DN2081_c0_g1~~TRINITY_DN2081_c0_g1_i4.p1  ORF type:complete len:1614 (+),score=272.90 TRINITY_DN2081_c0_g1_i4:73-4914(+)
MLLPKRRGSEKPSTTIGSPPGSPFFSPSLGASADPQQPPSTGSAQPPSTPSTPGVLSPSLASHTSTAPISGFSISAMSHSTISSHNNPPGSGAQPTSPSSISSAVAIPTSSRANPSVLSSPSTFSMSSLLHSTSAPSSSSVSRRSAQDLMGYIGPRTNLSSRIQIILEFCEIARTQTLEHVERVWALTRDLVEDPTMPSEAVLAGFQLINSCIIGQFQSLGLLRIEFFRVAQKCGDEVLHLSILVGLTKGGRDIKPFEREIVGRLVDMLSKTQAPDQSLNFCTNLVKFNHALLSDHDMSRLTQCVCEICDAPKSASQLLTMECCVVFLDTLVKYGTIPNQTLLMQLSTLCKLINIEKFSHKSWQVIQNMLISHIGHRTIRELCGILKNPANQDAVPLLRGAVFCLTMACWGSERIESLQYSFSSILYSFDAVLDGHHGIIDYEVTLSLQRLVKKYGPKLQVEWDPIISMLNKLYPHATVETENSLVKSLFKILDIISEMHAQGTFTGNTEQFFSVLELYKDFRNEDAMDEIIEYRQQRIHPSMPGWQQSMKTFLKLYVLEEKRPNVQAKALQVPLKVIESCGRLYDEELSEIAVAFLNAFPIEGSGIADRMISFIVTIASVLNTTRGQFENLIKIIEKLTRCKDTKLRPLATRALIDIFRSKFNHLPSVYPVLLFEMLINLINIEDSQSRKYVISTLTEVRADKRNCAYLEGGERSVFLRCTRVQMPKDTVCTLPVPKLVNALLDQLKRETNTEVHEVLTRGLRNMLINHHILEDTDIKRIGMTISKLLLDRTYISLIQELAGSEGSAKMLFDTIRVVSLCFGYSKLYTPSQHLDLLKVLNHTLTISKSWTGASSTTLQRMCINMFCHSVIEIPQVASMIFPLFVTTLREVSNFPHLYCNIILMYRAYCLRNTPSKMTIQEFQNAITMLFGIAEAPGNGLVMRLSHFALAYWASRSNYGLRKYIWKEFLDRYKESPELKTPMKMAMADWLLRSCFLDCSLTPGANLSIPSFLTADISSKSWMLGHQVLSVRCGLDGWTEVTLRRPTATLMWVVKLRNDTTLRELDFSERNKRISNILPRKQSVVINETNYPTQADAKAMPHREVSRPIVEVHNDVLSRSFSDPDLKMRVPVIHQTSNQQTSPIAINIPPKSTVPSHDPKVPRDAAPERIPPSTSTEFSISRLDSHSSSNSTSLSDLTSFYPPLPSYEASATYSPALFSGVRLSSESLPQVEVFDLEKCRLTIEGQLILHSSSPSSASPKDFVTAYAATRVRNPPIPSKLEPHPVETEKTESVALGHDSAAHQSPDPIRRSSLTEVLQSTNDIQSREKATHNQGDDSDRTHNHAAIPTITEASEDGADVRSPQKPISPLTQALQMSFHTPKQNRDSSQTSPPNTTDSHGEQLLSPVSLPGNVDNAPSITEIHHDNTNIELETILESITSSQTTFESNSILNPGHLLGLLQPYPVMYDRAKGLKTVEGLDRALTIFDRTPARLTHKIGVIYVASHQTTADQILGNECGSHSFSSFISNLGRLKRLKDCDLFTGGLDRQTDLDGEYFISWEDDIHQVAFHTTTLMPNHPNDPTFNSKRRHVGNNFVNIVFSERPPGVYDSKIISAS